MSSLLNSTQGDCAYSDVFFLFPSVPQKRKALSPQEPAAAGAPAEPTTPTSGHAPDGQPSKNEYEDGHITCEACGEEISFRDGSTGGFTVRQWDLHRAQW